MTREQALALFDTEWWKSASHAEIARFQMFEQRLCCPFGVFHEAVEQALGRPVWTHEFGLNWEGLNAELNGERPAPTMQEILDLIPAEKRIVLPVNIGGRP